MSRPRLKLHPHQTTKELEQTYRTATDPIERSHHHIIWLYAQHGNAEVVAALTAYSAVWVRELVKRYNHNGPTALRDLRHNNPGEARLLTTKQQDALRKALERSTPDAGLWTSAKVAAWIEATTGRAVSVVTGWKYLQRLDHTLQVPRPKHRDSATLEQREAFKKSLRRM